MVARTFLLHTALEKSRGVWYNIGRKFWRHYEKDIYIRDPDLALPYGVADNFCAYACTYTQSVGGGDGEALPPYQPLCAGAGIHESVSFPYGEDIDGRGA